MESQPAQKREYAYWGKQKGNNFSNENFHILDISQFQQAERCIIKLAQSKYLNKEMKKLLMKKQGSKGAEIGKSSQIYNFDLYLDEDGIIRVGGEMDN